MKAVKSRAQKECGTIGPVRKRKGRLVIFKGLKESKVYAQENGENQALGGRREVTCNKGVVGPGDPDP